MTAHKRLKKLVRERQGKTGESYQAALRNVTNHKSRGPGRFEKILIEAIEMARRIRDERAANPSTDPFTPAMIQRSRCEREFIDFLLKQTDADVFKMLAIMYAGREKEGDIRGWCEDARRAALDRKESAVSILLSKRPLADYLVDGLLLAKANGEDIEAEM